MRRRRGRRRRFESRGEDGAHNLSKFVREGPRSALASRRRRRRRVRRDGEGGVEFHREPVEQRREVFARPRGRGGPTTSGAGAGSPASSARGAVSSALRSSTAADPQRASTAARVRGEGPRERVRPPRRVHRDGGGEQPTRRELRARRADPRDELAGRRGTLSDGSEGLTDVGAAADASAGRSATTREEEAGEEALVAAVRPLVRGHRGVTRAEGSAAERARLVGGPLESSRNRKRSSFD